MATATITYTKTTTTVAVDNETLLDINGYCGISFETAAALIRRHGWELTEGWTITEGGNVATPVHRP